MYGTIDRSVSVKFVWQVMFKKVFGFVLITQAVWGTQHHMFLFFSNSSLKTIEINKKMVLFFDYVIIDKMPFQH